METLLAQLVLTLSLMLTQLGAPVTADGEVVTAIPDATPVYLTHGIFVDESGDPVDFSVLYNACTFDPSIELPACE